MRASACIIAVLLLAFVAYTSADCRSCCSPEGSCSRAFKSREGICCGVVRGRPFCCPRDASCVRKSGNRYACSFNIGSGKSGDTPADSPYRRDDDVSTCGFGCVLTLTLAFCFCLPCCCLIGYAIHLRRKRAAEAAQAAAAWNRPTPAPSYPPPVSYATTYGSGASGYRGPPNTPVTGYAGERMEPPVMGGETWQGAPHRLADEPGYGRGGGGGFGDDPYKTPQQLSGSSYPTIARSPPPRADPPLRSDPLSSITERAKSWFGVGGHEVAEPERPARTATMAGQRAEGAPGGLTISSNSEPPPPPPYAPR